MNPKLDKAGFLEKENTMRCIQLSNMGKIIGFALLFVCFVITPRVSIGEAWVIKPSVQLDGLYDDNIRLAPESLGSVFGSEVTGSVELSRLTDIIEVRGRAQASYITYTGDEAPSDTDNQVIAFSSLYKAQRDQWRLNGSFKRDTLLRTAEIIIEPEDITIPSDEDIDVLLFGRSVQRNRIVANPSWDYRATERMGLGLIYRLNYVVHEDVEGIDINDFQDHTVRGRVSYDLTEIDQVSTSIETRLFRTLEEDSEFDSYSLLASIDHRFSETTRVDLTVGIRHTSFETTNDEGDEFGYRVSIDGTKQTKFGRFSLRLERDLFPSGFGSLIETNQVLFRMNKGISPRLGFSMHARFFLTNPIEQEDSRNERHFFSIEPRLSWRLTRWWSVNATYRYRRQEREIESESAESNAFFVSLNYARPTR